MACPNRLPGVSRASAIRRLPEAGAAADDACASERES